MVSQVVAVFEFVGAAGDLDDRATLALIAGSVQGGADITGRCFRALNRRQDGIFQGPFGCNIFVGYFFRIAGDATGMMAVDVELHPRRPIALFQLGVRQGLVEDHPVGHRRVDHARVAATDSLHQTITVFERVGLLGGVERFRQAVGVFGPQHTVDRQKFEAAVVFQIVGTALDVAFAGEDRLHFLWARTAAMAFAHLEKREVAYLHRGRVVGGAIGREHLPRVVGRCAGKDAQVRRAPTGGDQRRIVGEAHRHGFIEDLAAGAHLVGGAGRRKPGTLGRICGRDVKFDVFVNRTGGDGNRHPPGMVDRPSFAADSLAYDR